MFGKKTHTPSENILILGLGGVGYYLAKRLAHEGYAITVIELASSFIREADGTLDARLIQGNAMSIECWREANAEKMDYLIAVTDNDAVNMLASMIADRFGAGYQVTESLIAFGSGGATGVGLGDGKQKLFFLPASHTDFLFSILGEELGFEAEVTLRDGLASLLEPPLDERSP